MNKIEIVGEIGWDVTASEVKGKLKGLSGDLTVEIASGGGSIFQGIQIFNAFEEYEGHITTVNTSMAASMASYLMLVGDTVKAYDNSVYMIHNALTFDYGNHNDFRKTADHLEALSNIIAQKYVQKTGKSLEEIKQLMDDETYLYGSEMLEMGIVDEMISTEKPKQKEKAIIGAESSFQACLASSKEHCKIEGYNTKIENILAVMPSERQAEKITNKTLKDTNMVAKKDFDALQAKYDALDVDKTDVEARLSDEINTLTEKFSSEKAVLEADLVEAKQESNLTAVLAFSGANRDVISFAKEAEFVKANTPLDEVMKFAMEAMASEEASADLQKENEEKATDSYLAEAILSINGGKK